MTVLPDHEIFPFAEAKRKLSLFHALSLLFGDPFNEQVSKAGSCGRVISVFVILSKRAIPLPWTDRRYTHPFFCLQKESANASRSVHTVHVVGAINTDQGPLNVKNLNPLCLAQRVFQRYMMRPVARFAPGAHTPEAAVYAYDEHAVQFECLFNANASSMRRSSLFE